MFLEYLRFMFFRCCRIRLFSSLKVMSRSRLDWWRIASLPAAGVADGDETNLNYHSSFGGGDDCAANGGDGDEEGLLNLEEVDVG